MASVVLSSCWCGGEEVRDLGGNFWAADELRTTLNQNADCKETMAGVAVPCDIEKLLIWERLEIKPDGMALWVYDSRLHVVWSFSDRWKAATARVVGCR
jgi:hypothetical protein